jgi:hypothetical protein
VAEISNYFIEEHLVASFLDVYKVGTGQMMNEVMTPFQHLIWKAMHMQSN